MPLRDHFHPPLSDRAPWDGFHGQWPAMIVIDLNKRLPPPYVASPRIHLGASFEIDVAATEDQTALPIGARGAADAGAAGPATAVWAPPEPTLTLETDLPEQDEYEVQVFEVERRRLVAAIEIVSPANKDRPESRRTFAAKCAALLRQGVSVSIVDLVTSRRSNLYAEFLDLLGLSDPSLTPVPPPLYAVEFRWRRHATPRPTSSAGPIGPTGPTSGASWYLDTWTHALVVGEPLPMLPLWVAADLAVPLALESSYEETCRILRIP